MEQYTFGAVNLVKASGWQDHGPGKGKIYYGTLNGHIANFFLNLYIYIHRLVLPSTWGKEVPFC